MIKRKLFIGLLIILLFNTGIYLGEITAKPIVKTQYINRLIEVPIEIIREVPRELKQFQSVAEFQEWFDGLTYSFEGDCDDWAYGFRDLAWADGYDIETEIWWTHMLCKTLIGNEIYFIDPQKHTFWLECYKD